MKGGVVIGPYVQGRIDQVGIPTKIITDKSRMHPSTFSRFVNGIKPVSERQLLEIGIAIGEAKSETQQAQLVRAKK